MVGYVLNKILGLEDEDCLLWLNDNYKQCAFRYRGIELNADKGSTRSQSFSDGPDAFPKAIKSQLSCQVWTCLTTVLRHQLKRRRKDMTSVASVMRNFSSFESPA
ncbi:hypothetical protein NPIL_129571 [Nephila pilipes]|uniref:Uncharacterized protein n=1 Tax=Nephila pilipes TaxID=299642 RepID=A0A8X6QDJ9_NEPPI|nr:hypothetical protein NPIL_129571 [Nephila pilipes]